MTGVLTDDHLEGLQCSKCRKYLSVFPVKIHPGRDVTCGRCSRDGDDGVRSMLYELIAEKYLFRCVNRYEGCRRLLRTCETEAHERGCAGNAFRCPKCADGADMSALALIWHYKLEHPSSYLKTNRFHWRGTGEDDMLYVQDDVLFVVSVRLDAGTGELRLSAVTSTDADATQMFLVTRDGVFLNRLERKQCKSRDTFDGDYFAVRLDSSDPVEIVFHLEVSKPTEPYSISEDFSPPDSSKAEDTFPADMVVAESDEAVETVEKGSERPSCEQIMIPLLTETFKSFSGYRLNDSGTALLSKSGVKVDLTCSNCKQLIGLPIYKCTNSRHFMCSSCCLWCGICNCTVCTPSERNFLLIQLSSYLKYPCKWKCGKYFTTDLRDHEDTCELRIKECPQCSSMIHLDFMEPHLLGDHKVYYCQGYDARKIKEYIERGPERGTFFFLLNDKWCYLTYRREQMAFSSHRFTFFTLDDALQSKLKILNGSSVLLETGIQIKYQYLCSFVPYLDFNVP